MAGAKKPKLPKHVDLILGPLPVDSINRTLGLELDPGDLVLTAGSQAHALKRHPDDYAKLLPHVGSVLKPHYMGDDLKNPGKIELVARVPAIGTALLVAIVVELDPDGRYRVASFYPVDERTVENRRQKKRLIIPK